MKAFRRRKKIEDPCDFLRRVIRIASTRASMASWGQPFEAIASWLILNMEEDASSNRGKNAKREK